jgi:hypothetical protein
MNSMHEEQHLEALMRITGCEIALDAFSPRDNAPAHYLERLNSACSVLTKRFGVSPDIPTIQLLCEMEDKEPYKLCAFMQTLATSRNPVMIAMAWRVIGGSRIKSVKMNFDDRQSFSLVVTAQRAKDAIETYKSLEVNDKRLLQHIALTPGADAPRSLGFFGLRGFP